MAACRIGYTGKRGMKRYRYSLILLRELVSTEFKLRYQGSVLGYLWSLLRPLFLFIILYFVFIHFLKIGSDIPHWPVALLLGIVLWNFFAEVTNNGINSVVERGDVIRKINFPKYVIILAGSVSALINLVLNLLVISVFMVINGIEPSWMMLLSPLFIIELFAFSLGIAFMLSAVFVFLRDINYIWEIIIQGLFYASAVIYPVALVTNMNPLIAKILLLNPVAQAIQDVRHVLIDTHNQTLYTLSDGNLLIAAIPIVITVVVAVVGMMLFRRLSPKFAENV